MKIIISSKYESYRQEVAVKLRNDFIDASRRNDLRASCYFCMSEIIGRGIILVDSYSVKDEVIMIPIHTRCYHSALLGEFDTFR